MRQFLSKREEKQRVDVQGYMCAEYCTGSCNAACQNGCGYGCTNECDDWCTNTCADGCGNLLSALYS